MRIGEAQFLSRDAMRSAAVSVCLSVWEAGWLSVTFCIVWQWLKNSSRFFRASAYCMMRDVDIANLSVRPSVRYVPVSDENGFTYRYSFFHRTVAQSF